MVIGFSLTRSGMHRARETLAIAEIGGCKAHREGDHPACRDEGAKVGDTLAPALGAEPLSRSFQGRAQNNSASFSSLLTKADVSAE